MPAPSGGAGWVENGLDELGEGARPLLEWLRPIAEAYAKGLEAAMDEGFAPEFGHERQQRADFRHTGVDIAVDG